MARFKIAADTRLDSERKIIAILKVLSQFSSPVGSNAISRELTRNGLKLSERAVRYHLKIADEYGFTELVGREGRLITLRGLEEIKLALVPEQVGYILDKVETIAFQTTFDPSKRSGQIPVSIVLVDKNKFRKMLAAIKPVFKAGICVSDRVKVLPEGERIGPIVVPQGKLGLLIVSASVFDGVLLKSGIPTEYLFGGILEVSNQAPKRFVGIVNYSGTSLHPGEQFMRAGMTAVRKAARTGNGMVLAAFREIPGIAKILAEERIAMLEESGIGGVISLGNIGEPVCQHPVSTNRVGIVLVSSMNPAAAAFEAGIDIEVAAPCGVIDFYELISFWDL